MPVDTQAGLGHGEPLNMKALNLAYVSTCAPTGVVHHGLIILFMGACQAQKAPLCHRSTVTVGRETSAQMLADDFQCLPPNAILNELVAKPLHLL